MLPWPTLVVLEGGWPEEFLHHQKVDRLDELRDGCGRLRNLKASVDRFQIHASGSTERLSG